MGHTISLNLFWLVIRLFCPPVAQGLSCTSAGSEITKSRNYRLFQVWTSVLMREDFLCEYFLLDFIVGCFSYHSINHGDHIKNRNNKA